MKKPRYYKTPYNEALKAKDRFGVPATQEFIDILFDLCDKHVLGRSKFQENGYKRILGLYVLSLPGDFDVSLIKKEYFADFYNEGRKNVYTSAFIKDFVRAYFVVNEKYHMNDELLEIEAAVHDYYDDIVSFGIVLLPLFDGSRDLHKVRFYRAKSLQGKHSLIVSTIDFDTDNKFIQDLLLEYLPTKSPYVRRIYEALFIEKFAESLSFNLPDNIYGFNVETLMQQEKFFMDLERPAELECRYFYSYIIKKQGDNGTMGLAEGITERYLLSENFFKTYSEGYRYVPYNPNEQYPSFDKWMLSPNGLEMWNASDKHEDIKPLDFSRISDPTIRNALKSWFWTEAKAGFENRRRNAIYVIEFFEFRDKLRSMYFDKFIQGRCNGTLDVEHTVLAEEIVGYTNEWDQKVTNQSYRSRIIPLKKFLLYLVKNELYGVDTGSFEYLTTGNKLRKTGQEILPIPKEDFSKLISILEEKAKSNDLHMLYYIIFCLNVLTPLRISSILDLDVDCVEEKIPGVFAVNAKVKTSGGNYKQIQISKEVKRLIDVAISLTETTRSDSPESIRHYLFLVNNQKDLYKAIPAHSYDKHLERCCYELGLPRYSARNLRKTYYTNLIENAIKNNVSLMNLRELTCHATIDTTENYYVKENIRNYLEATTGVEIGNMPIAGEVLDVYPEADKEDLVNEGCGFCRNPECNVLGTANCLMCKGFVTTPERIPQVEESIAILSKQITQNKNQHDKEHLYAVKRLYVAYLEQMYIRKELSENHD